MAGLLGDIYSYGDTLKRKVKGLLADPVGTVSQMAGQFNDDMNTQIGNMRSGYGFDGGKSVLASPEQQASARRSLADYGAQNGLAGMAVSKETLADAMKRLQALQRGEKVDTVLKGGLVATPEQSNGLNEAFSALTGNKQPPYKQSSLDIDLQHIYDSRMSGKVKPSGQVSDTFSASQVVPWIESAGSDAAHVGAINGKPHLQNIYNDPSGESYVVRMPISGNFSTGKQWASGLIPVGKYQKKKP